jgi:hypothetical protein
VNSLKEVHKAMTSDGMFYYVTTTKSEKREKMMASVFNTKIESEKIGKI